MSWYTQIMRWQYNTGVMIIKNWPHGLVKERNEWLLACDMLEAYGVSDAHDKAHVHISEEPRCE